MGWVGANGIAQQLLAARIVEMMNELWVALEALGGGDVFNAMILPETIGGAKRIDARLRRDARAGEYHD